MFDTVTVSDIPSFANTSADAVAYYVDGIYADERQVIAHDPRSRHLSIAVRAGDVADCLDIENGDATPAQAAGWWHDATMHGVWRPCFYASVSVMPVVVRELAAAGIHRSSYRLWQAHYDDVAVVPAGYDAKQFSDHALGRHLDESVCLTTFFPAPKSPPKKPADLLDAAMVTFDPDTRGWAVHELPAEHVAAG
jgi:hypothetical protein